MVLRRQNTERKIKCSNKSFYNKIKYGTDNINVIFLMEHGFSFYLSKELIDKYANYITINFDNDSYLISEDIIEKMNNDSINDILIFELKQFV